MLPCSQLRLGVLATTRQTPVREAPYQYAEVVALIDWNTRFLTIFPSFSLM